MRSCIAYHSSYSVLITLMWTMALAKEKGFSRPVFPSKIIESPLYQLDLHVCKI